MFVSFEGIDGAGKSTALSVVARRLEAMGHHVVCTREPGAMELGAAIRQILLSNDHAMPPLSELFLFLADRANHVANLIRPALAAGSWVLCDRFADSTVVYQGYGRGLDLEQLRHLNSLATEQLQPARTILFDLPIELSNARLTKRDRLDQETEQFRERVRKGFLTEAALAPDRWRVVDASQSPDEVAEACWQILSAAK